MNKRTLLKGKAMACLILTCLLLVLSCRKENLLPNSNILEKGLSIQEAKMYFEKNFQKSLKSKTLLSSGAANGLNGQDILAGKQPMWDASVLKNLSLNTNAVLTPIYKEGLYVHISGKKMVKFGFLNYMMMYRNSKDSIVTEWVELKPTEKWIESKFSRNYEGRILIKDWDGKLKRVINYKEAKTDKLSNSLNAKKLAINGSLMTGNSVITVCNETTIYTVITYGPRALCGCKPAHTFEEWAAGQCICSVDKIPRKGYTTTIDVETTEECYEIDEDGGIKGGGSAPVGGGTHPTLPGGNGNGGANPGDYTPIHCNPDPNYIVPTTPPPAGQDYAIPCSELAIPDDDIPDPNDPVIPLTSTELLIHYYNSDANVDMHLTSAEITFLSANSSIVKDLKDYLQAETLEKKESGRWAIGYLNENRNLTFANILADFLCTDAGLDVSDLGTESSGQDLNYSIYFDNGDGSFKAISKSDPNYDNVINNGTTSLPTSFAPATTQALRQMGRSKGWDIGVSPLEFNRRVGQAFQEAVFRLYNQKLLPPQRFRVNYQPQNNISTWRAGKVGNSGQVIPDWTYDISFMGTSVPLSQHWFYDAKAVTGMLYLSSSKYQIAGYIDVLSRKKVLNAPPPALIFVTPVNTIISPSILATAIAKGVQIRQAFVMIINNKLYLLQSIELTPTNDKFTNIPTNMLQILSGPVDLEYPVVSNSGPDYEEIQ